MNIYTTQMYKQTNKEHFYFILMTYFLLCKENQDSIDLTNEL